MPAPSKIVVKTLTTLDAVDELAEDWRALEALTPEATGFQSYLWCRNWIAASELSGIALEFRVVALRIEGRLAMLWPLQVERKFGVRLLRWLGEPMTQYGDALASPSQSRADWRRRVEMEIKGWRSVDLVALGRLREDGVLAGCGLRICAHGERPWRLSSILRRLRRASVSARAPNGASANSQPTAKDGWRRLRRAGGATSWRKRRSPSRARGCARRELSAPACRILARRCSWNCCRARRSCRRTLSRRDLTSPRST